LGAPGFSSLVFCHGLTRILTDANNQSAFIREDPWKMLLGFLISAHTWPAFPFSRREKVARSAG
jgi:hypothetical protein